MTLKIIVEKLARSPKKFITSDELKEDCSKLSLDYYTLIRYLIRNKHLARIFKGIFYVYSLEEKKLGKLEMNFYSLMAEAMKLKGVKSWYFGLETALKLNNITHEYFSVEYIINDKIFRSKPIKIMGKKVKFYKLVPKMLKEGIIRKGIPHSDPEKTALDLFYLKHYDISNFNELAESLDRSKLDKYSKIYDKRTINAAECLK
jgi:hypothetical protein